MLLNARCLCTFYSFLPMGMGAIGGKFTAVLQWMRLQRAGRWPLSPPPPPPGRFPRSCGARPRDLGPVGSLAAGHGLAEGLV